MVPAARAQSSADGPSPAAPAMSTAGVPAAAGGPAVQPVPTLSQYALMALALGMFLMAARRRQGKRRR